MDANAVRVTDYLTPQAIITELRGSTGRTVVMELVAALAAPLGLSEADAAALVDEAMRRERQGTSALGRGIAIPHIKHRTVARLAVSLGCAHRGIAFSALDGKPVQLFALVLSPEPAPTEYTLLLARLLHLLQDKGVRQMLLSGRNSSEIMLTFQETRALP